MESTKAYKYSIKILSKRDYSIFKMRQKLCEKGYAQEADELIELLIEKRYLREDLYIEARVQGLIKKNYAHTYITSKLKEEQINLDYSYIDSIYQEWDYTTEKQILDLKRKKCIIHDWNDEDLLDFNKKLKMSRFIHSKGHSWEDINKYI